MSVLIPRKNELEVLKQKFKQDGFGKMHVLADFDSTLTKCIVNGREVSSVISILRDKNYINSKYSEEAKKLYSKYYPVEIDPSIPVEEKKALIYEWWTKHFELLMRSGLNRSHLERIVNSGEIEFREGALDFIDSLNRENIPLVIISSSGVGNVLPMLLEREGRLYDNVFVIGNFYEWDKNGRAVRISQPIITVMNKDETVLKDIPHIYKSVRDRRNVLLLGDSLGDLGMISGFDYTALIRVGFLNKKIEESLKQYKQNFDIVITDDGDFSAVNKLMDDIK